MSAGAIAGIVAAVIIVAAVAAAATLQRGATGSRLGKTGSRLGATGPGLKRRFGPEYERTLARHDGDKRAARRELAERVKRYGRMEHRPLPAQAREGYAAQWAAVQTKFVDDPAMAVGAADALIARLATELGYPAADSPEHVDALSVHHPHHVHAYREAHAAATGGGRHGTEELRKALVAARGMFDGLLDAGGRAAPPAPKPVPAKPDAGGTEGAARSDPKAALGKRLAALTGRGRTEAGQ